MLKRVFILAAAAIVVAASALLAVPGLRERAETIPLRVEAWWHDLQPRAPYVPPPPDEPKTSARTEATIPPSPTSIMRPERSATAAPTTTGTRLPPLPTATATPTLPAPPAEARLSNFRHEYQGWNNCGPVTVGMLLSHYGFSDTQKEIAPVLKPNTKDQNVSPEEMASYVRSKAGFDALIGINGDLTMLKRLVANDLPVIVETWFTPKPNDGMGHYRLLFAYNDSAQQFTALDSYNGPNLRIDYAELDENWKAFHRLYIVGYRREQEALVRSLTGYEPPERMWRRAEERARDEITKNPDDAYAWFNLGGALTHGDQPREASAAFDRARRIGLPWRMLWYQHEIFEAYLATGRVQETLDLANLTIKQTGELEEAQYYRGLALETLGRRDDAQKAFREALRLNPNYRAAATALTRAGG